MTTVALNERSFTENNKKVSLKERFAAYFEEHGVEIACGLRAISGCTDAFREYQMLRK